MSQTQTKFHYERWRHGGWYVYDVRYPSGAVGCVSRNYDDGKWRIVCHPLQDKGPTFKSRDDAARAEMELAKSRFRDLTIEDIEADVSAQQARFGERANAFCDWLRQAHAEAVNSA